MGAVRVKINIEAAKRGFAQDIEAMTPDDGKRMSGFQTVQAFYDEILDALKKKRSLTQIADALAKRGEARLKPGTVKVYMDRLRREMAGKPGAPVGRTVKGQRKPRPAVALVPAEKAVTPPLPSPACPKPPVAVVRAPDAEPTAPHVPSREGALPQAVTLSEDA
jgi:hypothetical protein